ncbi:hypothetical protein C8Q79DRAFT_1013310 [Trametes meyenii]|nr:hypothetical protein C8Q79DRAFT_1013310 [Trametes meyenii]
MTQLEDLPVELLIQVILALLPDRRALAAVASLNTSWRAFCLPYLFEKLEITNPHPSTLVGFIIFLESQLQIRTFIQELSFSKAPDGMLMIDTIDVFTRTMSVLPNLKVLTLRRVWFKQYAEPSRNEVVGRYANVARVRRYGPFPLRRLVIDSCLAGNRGSLVEFPGLFSIVALFKLGTLYLAGFHTTLRDGPYRSNMRPQGCTRPLDLEGIDMVPALAMDCTNLVVDEFRTRLLPDRFRSLRLTQVTKKDVRAAGVLIRAKGLNLTHITLDVVAMSVEDLEDSVALWSSLSLERCFGLECLTFHLAVGTGTSTGLGPSLCHSLVHLLVVSPRNLRRLSIVLRAHGTEPATSLTPAELASLSDLPAIERALLRLPFSCLESVEVVMDFGEQMPVVDWEGWLTQVRRLLPRLQANGLLMIKANRHKDEYTAICKL